MSTMAAEQNGEIRVLRQQVSMAHHVVRLNVEGLTQEETLLKPSGGGNCMNWVVGHLLAIYDVTLPALGQKPVLAPAIQKRYDRGSAPLRDGTEAVQIGELMTAWDESTRRVDAGLASLDADALGSPAPFSPGNDPKETLGTLLTTILWHQAYHVGQTGILRRVAGKKGTIG